MLALKGVDPRRWSAVQLVNAIEAQILGSASDDKERAKLHARLYAPPRGLQRARPTGVPTTSASPADGRTQPRTGIQASSVADLLNQIQAEDKRLGSL